jgi:hypothetical protein
VGFFGFADGSRMAIGFLLLVVIHNSRSESESLEAFNSRLRASGFDVDRVKTAAENYATKLRRDDAPVAYSRAKAGFDAPPGMADVAMRPDPLSEPPSAGTPVEQDAELSLRARNWAEEFVNDESSNPALRELAAKILSGEVDYNEARERYKTIQAGDIGEIHAMALMPSRLHAVTPAVEELARAWRKKIGGELGKDEPGTLAAAFEAAGTAPNDPLENHLENTRRMISEALIGWAKGGLVSEYGGKTQGFQLVEDEKTGRTIIPPTFGRWLGKNAEGVLRSLADTLEDTGLSVNVENLDAARAYVSRQRDAEKLSQEIIRENLVSDDVTPSQSRRIAGVLGSFQNFFYLILLTMFF